MFKGMYELVNKGKAKRLNEKGIINADPTPILNPEDLLATDKCKQLMLDIRTLFSLPDEEYDRVFLPVIHNFAAFVQNLPETQRSYYSSLGGMLEHGLERASLSLFLCRTYLLPENVSLESLSEEEMLWVYAVFTAALLLDVGKIATRHIVTFCDAEGNQLRAWIPYSGSMVGQGTHYLYGFSEEHHDHMRHLVTPLLARQILPQGASFAASNADTHLYYGGFNWLASDPDVLESWLAMLADDHRQVGSILTVIPLADVQILDSAFADRQKVFRHNLLPQTIAFLDRVRKERKEVQKELKIQKEEKLQQDAKKSQDRVEAEKTTKLEQVKTTKTSMFGFPSHSQQDQPKVVSPAVLDNAAIRDVAKRFVDWTHQSLEKKSITFNQAGSQIFTAQNKVFMNEQTLQKFLSEVPNLPVKTLPEVREALKQAEVARPLSVAEMAQIPALAAAATQTLVVQSPNLVMGLGVGQMAQAPALQAQMALQSQTPAQPVQTAAEAYQEAQQKAQQQIQATPRPSPNR